MEKKYINKIEDISPMYKIWFSKNVEPLFDYHNPWEENEIINYKLNNYGLRCDDFYPIDNPQNHIIFAGCENTIPMDVKYEDGWAYRIHKEFFKNKCNFINLSYPGADSDRIVFNILKYINTYGKPSKIFILMPELIRAYGFWPETKGFKPKMYRQYAGGEEHNLMAIPHDLPPQLLALKFIQSIFFLEQYCKDANIDLCWTSWDSETNIFIKKYQFKGFFDFNSNGLLDQNKIFIEFKKRIEEII